MERNSGKIIQLDYETLVATAGDQCSYCLSPRTAMIALAFMDYARWKTRYIITDTPFNQTDVDNWIDLAESELMVCVDGNAILKNTELILDEILRGWLGQTPAQINPAFPNAGWETNTGDDETTHARRVDALCYACLLLVQYGCAVADKRLHELIDNANLAGAILEIAAAVAAEFMTAGAATPFILAFLSGAAFTAGSALSFLSDEILNDVDAQAEAACILHAQLQAHAVTSLGLYQSIYLGGDIFGSTAQMILAGIAIIEAQNQDAFFNSFINFVAEANRFGLAGLLPSCPCDDFCHYFDFAAGQYNFDADPVFEIGVWNEGTGWQNTDASNAGVNYRGVRFLLEWATPTRIDYFTWHELADVCGDDVGGANTFLQYKTNAGYFDVLEDIPTADGDHVRGYNTPVEGVTGIRVIHYVCSQYTNPLSGSTLIDFGNVCGSGFDPFV